MDREVLDDGIVQVQAASAQAWESVGEAFLAPGQLTLEYLLSWFPTLASMLGAESPDDTARYAAVVSLVSWVLAAVLLKAAYNVVRNTCLSIASLYRRFMAAAGFRLRMVGRRVAEPVRTFRIQERKSRFLEEFEISELQLAILRAQSRRPPGQVITAVEAAEELRVRPLVAQQALTFLAQMHLMEVSFATSDGCPAYFLTRSGEAYLASCGTRRLPDFAVSGAPT